VSIDIRSMGYVRVASTDLDQWRHFATKVLGLAEGRGPHPDHLYFRIDAVSARLVVVPADVDQLACTGWEGADHQALQAAREHLKEAGVAYEEGSADELDERRVQELVRFEDPFGNVFELFHGITYESRPVVTPYGARFVTGDQGMGHIVVPVDDDVEALRFYSEVLGFRLRDSMSMPGEFVGKEPGSKVWLRFLGVNPRHHSLAFLPMPNPARCVHIMLEVEELDDVGHQAGLVTDHLELDPRRAEGLAGQAGGQHRLARRGAAGGVGQQPHARGPQQVEEPAGPGARGAAHRDRHQRRVGGLEDGGQEGEVRQPAGAQEEA